jgi:hypothetical protein
VDHKICGPLDVGCSSLAHTFLYGNTSFTVSHDRTLGVGHGGCWMCYCYQNFGEQKHSNKTLCLHHTLQPMFRASLSPRK